MADLLVVIMVALGLSADAFAVSVATGALYREFKFAHALRMACFFGGFQAVMPVIGWLAGTELYRYIERFDHWVAFGLLAAIGAKMIWESFKLKKDQPGSDPSKLMVLFVLAIATSIDALAVGLTLSLMKTPLAYSVSIIGAITFLLTLAGVEIGKRFGHFFESKIEAIGGLILIGIGVKILIEHLR